MVAALSVPGDVEVLLGATGTGKTRALAEKAARLSAEFPDGAVLVLAASAQGADDMRRELERLGAARSLVATPCEVALKVLSTPKAVARTRRRPRLLLAFEEAFLLDDLLTLGVKEKRLREMLKFFDRMDSELACEADWLEAGEESAVRRRQQLCLEAYGGLRRAEVRALAVRFLEDRPDQSAPWRVAHVLVDDFTLMDRASQHLAGLLAAETLTVAADPLRQGSAGECYPFAKGVEELMAAAPFAVVREFREPCGSSAAFSVAQALTRAADSQPLGETPVVVRSESASAGQPGDSSAAPSVEGGSVEEHGFVTFDDETAFVADEVARTLASGVPAREIVVLGFHPMLRRAVAEALEQRGVAVAQRGSRSGRCQVHDPRHCDDERALALLALAADGRDGAAWRAMIGFGDPLGRSQSLDAVRQWGAERGLGFAEALVELGADDFAAKEAPAGLGPVAAVCRAVRRQLERLKPSRGRALLDGVAQAVAGCADASAVPVLSEIADAVGPDEDALSLFERASRCFEGACFAADGVRLGSPEDLAGVPCQALFVTGFVNGLTPPRRYFDRTARTEQEARSLWTEGAHALYPVLGHGARRIVVSFFTRIEPEQAQRIGVYAARVRMERGRRVCVVEPSDYLAVVRPTQDER